MERERKRQVYMGGERHIKKEIDRERQTERGRDRDRRKT